MIPEGSGSTGFWLFFQEDTSLSHSALTLSLPSPNPLPGEGCNATGHNSCVRNYLNNSEWNAFAFNWGKFAHLAFASLLSRSGFSLSFPQKGRGSAHQPQLVWGRILFDSRSSSRSHTPLSHCLYPLPTLSQERASTPLATTVVSRITLTTVNRRRFAFNWGKYAHLEFASLLSRSVFSLSFPQKEEGISPQATACLG